MRKWTLYTAGVALIIGALAAGVYAGYKARQGPPEAAALQALMATPFTTPEGEPATLERWRGKTLLVNFWATWCTPCREEMPLFNATQAQYAANGVQFVGIAIDSAEPVQAFAKQLGIVYPLLVSNAAGLELARRLGNRAGGLPYTIVVTPDGRLAHAHLGQVREADLRRWLGQPPG